MQAKYYEMTATIHALGVDNIVGSSQATRELKKDIAKIAGSSSTVLITGESGTGKEMVATAIWDLSKRRKERFVAVQSTGHIWTKEEVEATTDLQREFNNYLDSFMQMEIRFWKIRIS